MNIYLSELAELTEGRWTSSLPNDFQLSTVFTDTRKVYADDHALFIALTGKHFDAHNYLELAYEKGLRYFLVEKQVSLPSDAFQLIVSNTLLALQEMGAHVRNKFSAPVYGVTGSNGKTMFKEWFSALLEDEISVFKSPKSYNSQVGVPLSLLPLTKEADISIFEAGISEPGEMLRLQRMLKPTLGIFTHLGSAHDENFDSRDQKLREKLILFKDAKSVILPHQILKQNEKTIRELLPNKRLITVGKEMEAEYRVVIQERENEVQIVFESPDAHVFTIPFSDRSSINNILLAIVAYLRMELPLDNLQAKLNLLRSIPMRQQFVRAKGNSVIINDSYSLDKESLVVALDFLQKQAVERTPMLILSDFPQGDEAGSWVAEVKELAENRGISNFVGIGPEMCKEKPLATGRYFPNAREFLNAITSFDLTEKAILIKGARVFQLEKVVNALQEHQHQTQLEINLSAIVRNYNALKIRLNPEVQTMAMVKAAAYGGGNLEVANVLVKNGVDAIGVAFTQEGIDLRNAGIKCPILVLSPWWEEAKDIIKYNLTPSVYRLQDLEHYEKLGNLLQQKVKVHIKLETGMNRLGFQFRELEEVIALQRNFKSLKISGVYSHFAGADEADFDSFTYEQIALFKKASGILEDKLGRFLIKHIANTSGMLRFPDSHFDMVRLGIGLYGHNPSPEKQTLELAMSFKTKISQIRNLEPGESVGYSRKFKADEGTQIGILPIGYADGLPRSSGNGKFSVYVVGKGLAPIIGNVCMDLCMINLKSINAKEGDGVIIFGPKHPIEHIAKANATIPYEILSRISQRVKRVYYED